MPTYNPQWDLALRRPAHGVGKATFAYNHNLRVSPGIRKSTLRINSGLNYLF